MNRFKLIWLNITFYSLLVVFSLAAIPLILLLIGGQAPFSTRRRILRLTRLSITWYGSIIINRLPQPLVRVCYEDFTNGCHPLPAVVVFNHKSASDPFLIAALPLGETIQIANTWPFRLPVWGIIARLAGYLSIKEMPMESFMKAAGQLLREGVCLATFPEGTRAGSGQMGQFHGAIFRLALQEKAPIIPVCILGNEHTPPRGTGIIRPAIIRVRQLPALVWDDYKDMTPFHLKNHVRALIARELKSMEALP